MKNSYSASRKKLRGWKRRIKQIEAWGEHIKQPDLKYLNSGGNYTYDRCILYPFYTLEKRQPPLWFYKLIISRFIAACFEWDKTFKDMDIAYDLQLWVYDPSFMWSEIICYRVEKPGDKARYDWEPGSQKAFPYAKFAKDDADLKKFEWLLTDEELVTFENELEDENYTAEDLIKDGYIKKIHNEYGAYYSKRTGDMWVGRLKK